MASNIKREFLPEEQFVINYKTSQIVDDMPHAISESYIPYSYFSGLYEKLNEKHVSLYAFFEKNGYKPTHKKEILRVDAPSIDERIHLNIVDANRVNVVRIQGYVYSGDILVELCLLCDRSDLYEFHYEITM
ncbi:MAG: UTRA domain-containing protein [Candidatus Thiodiazotropha sp.]